MQGVATAHSPLALLMVLSFVLGAVAWFQYFLRKDVSLGQPLWKPLVAMAGGAMSVGSALAMFGASDALGSSLTWAGLQGDLPSSAARALAIGAIEEWAKMFPVLLIAQHSRRFGRARYGLFLSACAGIGFATAESVVLLVENQLTWIDCLARAAAAPACHALFAVPWGVGVGRVLKRGRSLALLSGFALSAAAHGLYDLLLAREGVPRPLAACVVLGIWIWMLVQMRPTMRPAPVLVPMRTVTRG